MAALMTVVAATTVLSIASSDSAIETAVCLNGKTDGFNADLGDVMGQYCFVGYDENNRPVYKGHNAEIKWTDTATDYGAAYGLFDLYSDDAYPVAYCLHGDEMDVTACSGEWFMNEHGASSYRQDHTMELVECECSDIDLLGPSLVALIDMLKEDVDSLRDRAGQTEEETKSDDDNIGNIDLLGPSLVALIDMLKE